MTIFFVGIHNKPGLMPLCGSTKTGKIINKIVARMPKEAKCVRTNLFEGEFHPNNEEFDPMDWYDRYEVSEGDIVVLLGNWVHKNFRCQPELNIIKTRHPASFLGAKKQSEFILETSEKILKLLP